ncbi:MAG: hypothetical protein AVDCRST_MAG18-636, partial [uncultured Thermomicrobiales bacterium]
ARLSRSGADVVPVLPDLRRGDAGGAGDQRLLRPPALLRLHRLLRGAPDRGGLHPRRRADLRLADAGDDHAALPLGLAGDRRHDPQRVDRLGPRQAARLLRLLARARSRARGLPHPLPLAPHDPDRSHLLRDRPPRQRARLARLRPQLPPGDRPLVLPALHDQRGRLLDDRRARDHGDGPALRELPDRLPGPARILPARPARDRDRTPLRRDDLHPQQDFPRAGAGARSPSPAGQATLLGRRLRRRGVVAAAVGDAQAGGARWL